MDKTCYCIIAYIHMPSIIFGGVPELLMESSEKISFLLTLASNSLSCSFSHSFSSLSLLFSPATPYMLRFNN
jgi:hypothetical protein